MVGLHVLVRELQNYLEGTMAVFNVRAVFFFSYKLRIPANNLVS